MIDLAKVREALNDYENNANIVYEAIDELERLQKKEVPMKVAHHNNGMRYCPVCEKSYLHNGHGNENKFCGYCGVKLDWSNKK